MTVRDQGVIAQVRGQGNDPTTSEHCYLLASSGSRLNGTSAPPTRAVPFPR